MIVFTTFPAAEYPAAVVLEWRRLRWRVERRVELARTADAAGGRGAKTARRPGGKLTVKADMDDLARDAADRPERERLRRRIEGRGDNGGIRSG